MSSAAKQDTVWMGFMDIVPVIGSVKEAVELVLALYEGDKAVILKKEKAFENILKELLKKYVKLTPAAAADDEPPAAAADEYSGLRNVREVSKEKIIEHMVKGSKKGTKPPTAAEQKERQKKVDAIQKDMLKKIKKVLKTDFNEELKEELKRSEKGEHVFNNDILKFHFKVLTEFIQGQGIDNRPGYIQIKDELNALGKHTLCERLAAEIQTNMVFHFGADEFYVNANAVMYGVYCRALRDALLVVLRNINVTQVERDRVNFVIDNMNNFEIYVDELAKVSWIANKRDRQERFNRVKQDVVPMYKTARGLQWCFDILHVVQRFYNNGQ